MSKGFLILLVMFIVAGLTVAVAETRIIYTTNAEVKETKIKFRWASYLSYRNTTYSMTFTSRRDNNYFNLSIYYSKLINVDMPLTKITSITFEFDTQFIPGDGNVVRKNGIMIRSNLFKYYDENELNHQIITIVPEHELPFEETLKTIDVVVWIYVADIDCYESGTLYWSKISITVRYISALHDYLMTTISIEVSIFMTLFVIYSMKRKSFFKEFGF